MPSVPSSLTLAITLPHVVLLHSVTSLQYKGHGLVESDLHLVFPTHYPYLYSTNLSTLIGLGILTHYSSFDLTVHYNLTPLLYL